MVPDMTDELREFLRQNYNLYYDHTEHAWMRSDGKWDKKSFDLGAVTKLITGENVMTKGNSYVQFLALKIHGSVCVCGCPLCNFLYPMYHKKTNICFMVGSECIKKAGHENFVHDLKCAAKNGICLDCQQPLVFQGKRKNCNKKDSRCRCIECYNKKKLLEMHALRVREEERREEKRIREQERLSRIQKVFLNISYENKDKYKIYNTKWDCEAKLWYWEGDINDLPEPLVALQRC